MEEQKNVLLGIYVMGIRKRPDLANQPCILQYIETEGRLVLSITANGGVENFSFDKSKLVSASNSVRTIMSQDEFKDTSVNQANIQLLATAVTGPYGALIGTLVGKSGMFNSSNSGSVTYSTLNEVRIAYINDENEQRNMVIHTDLDPSGIIDYINQQV